MTTRNHWSSTIFFGLLLIAGSMLIPARAPADDVNYPKISLAAGYVVDPSWPHKPPAARWDAVSGIAVDGQDRVYVFTRGTPPVQVYDMQGNHIRSWGEDTIKSAHHIKIGPDGNVWVADIGYHTVQRYTPEGKLSLVLGTRGEAGRDKTHFNMPTDMAVTPAGDVFVSDGYGNARIVHINKDGKFVKEWGELGSRPGQFSIPHAIAVDSKGRLYVADRNNVRVQVFNQEGKLLDVWNNLITPWGLCVTGNDEIWVCGSSPMRWRKEDKALGCPPKDQVFIKFNAEGKVVQLWTVPKAVDGLEKPGECNWVHAIAVDSRGSLYLGDIIGKRAQKFIREE
jgi:DNA-binding beta-propeller fold protein YncE